MSIGSTCYIEAIVQKGLLHRHRVKAMLHSLSLIGKGLEVFEGEEITSGNPKASVDSLSAVILHQSGQDRTAERVDPGLAQTLDRKMGEEREPHTAIAIDPRLIDRYVGRYLNDKLEMTASREGDQLFVQVTGYNRYPVYPYTDHDFFATVLPAQISFVADQTGIAARLGHCTLFPGGADAVHARTASVVFAAEDQCQTIRHIVAALLATMGLVLDTLGQMG